MDVYLDRNAMQQLVQSIEDCTGAPGEEDLQTLRDDIVELFPAELIEQLEMRIDTGDFHDFVALLLEEWSQEDYEELLELMEVQLAEADVDFDYHRGDLSDDDDDVDKDSVEEELSGEVDDGISGAIGLGDDAGDGETDDSVEAASPE